MRDYRFSRLASSASTALRTKSVRSSPSASTLATRANVPAANRACMFSDQSGGRPTARGVSDTTFSAKARLFLISPIDPVTHITYISHISYGGKTMGKLILRCNACANPATERLVGGRCEICHAVEVATDKRRFERKGDAWYSTVIETGSGQGRFDEAEALAQHHRLIGLDVLTSLGYSDDETRDFDWHLWPTDSVEAFVAKGIAEWAEVLNARAEMLPINALISAVTGVHRP